MILASEIDEALRLAVAEIQRGNLVVADFLAQDVLRRQPENPIALNLVGIIAGNIGLRDRAISCFERSIQHAPQHQSPRSNLAAAKTLSPPVEPSGKRYLLIKSWGFGFWADVTHVLACLLLAEITGRIPVTHWGDCSLFSDRSGQDAFQLYFKPISRVTIATLSAARSGGVFPLRWAAGDLRHEDLLKLRIRGPAAIHFLARSEKLVVSDYYFGIFELLPWIPETHPLHGRSIDEVYRTLSETYLKPVAAIAAAIDAFHRRHLDGRKTIAVHARGSDKTLEFPALDEFNRSYFTVLDAEDPASTIFVLTDDERVLDLFQSRYGDRVVATTIQRTKNDTGPHHTPSMDKMALGREVVSDVYLALRCAKFVGNGRSNVSCVIDLFKDWQGNSVLLAPSQLRDVNYFLYGG